jgi:hypothetical protein
MLKKTICLNMIVKNESHIIEETLKKLCNKINFDYWVISDTGSSDNTPQIIQNFFDKENIKGELYFDKWKDFGHNRTLALNYAFNKTDYLFIFDADDEIIGDLKIPELSADGYQFKFGHNELSYDRILLINNRKKWIFQGVLHEIIKFVGEKCDIEMIHGNYNVISGRKGNRNKNPNKYYDDAIILEKAYIDAITENDKIAGRYAFYCANSYFDAKIYEKAIEWYKRYLKIGDWNQEKYVACRNIFISYFSLKQMESGFFYLFECCKYDKERTEWILPLISYYVEEKEFDIVSNLYNIIKDFYENKYLNFDFSKKLFYDNSCGDLLLPFHMIHFALSSKNMDIGVKMYEIIFTKKNIAIDENMIKILLHNLQFFLTNISKNNKYFFNLFEEYLVFLQKSNINLTKYNEYITIYRLYYHNNPEKQNILFFSGFLDKKWNYTCALNCALGGSESAVAFLSECFNNDYNVYVAGDVNEEIYNSIYYINNSNLQYLIQALDFKVVIISRFLIFLEAFPNIQTEKIFIWGHDVELSSNGTNLTSNEILRKHNSKINCCICLTEWHKGIFSQKYPELSGKIFTINNGIKLDFFNNINTKNKKKNQFIYTSRSERGLQRLLELWEKITEKIPDATLAISSYTDFPNQNYQNDIEIQNMLDKYNNVKHYGKLNKMDLYNLMAQSEYWFYPCIYPETSCITAMEMMMCEVICIYYPLAGLVNTIGNYGLPVDPSIMNEIDFLSNLVDDKNKEIRENIKNREKEYILTCTWNNRKNEWDNLIEYKKNNKICILIIYSKSEYYDKMKKLSEHHYKNYKNLDNIDYYYITLDPNIQEEYIIKNHDFIIKGNESYVPGILDKSLFAFDLFKDKYDYIVRSNVSTVIDINNLVKYLDINNVDYGGSVLKLNCNDEKYNLTEKYLGTIFVEGTSIVLSNKIVNFILENKNILPNVIDDVAIGYLLTKNNIYPTQLNILGNSTFKTQDNIFYRNKSSHNPKFINNSLLKENVLTNMTNVINELHNCNHIYIPELERFYNSGQSENIDIDFDSFKEINKKTYNNIFGKKEYKNVCFIHSFTKNNNTITLDYIVNYIIDCGCIDILDNIFIFNIGDKITKNYRNTKIIIINYSKNGNLYELQTLKFMHLFSQYNKNTKILYLHTKGQFYKDEIHNNVKDWVNYMLYALSYNYKLCLEKLDNYNTVGCNMQQEPKLHYSGNFWWTNSEYFSTLDTKKLLSYFDAEFFILSSNSKHYCIHNSNKNHYNERYHIDEYKNILFTQK